MNAAVNPLPTVSIILSVYNGERYLRQAMDSILNQTFTDFEFIIVDDGSTDETAAILKSSPDPRIVRLVHSTNQGLIASLNDGLSIASGQFIARIDADDISLPNRLEEQVRIFKTDPQLVIVGSYSHRIDETGKQIKIVPKPLSDTAIRWTLLFECPFVNSAVMIRKDALHRNGLRYDKDRLYAEDYDLWSKLLLYGKGRNSDQPLVKRRLHPSQVSAVFVAEQVATADFISWSNLQRLGISISASEVKILRSWSWKPILATKQNIRTCRNLLDILLKFGKQEVVDPQQFAVIRYRWVNKILGALSLKDLLIFRKVPLLGLLLREHGTLVVRHLIKRGIGKS